MNQNNTELNIITQASRIAPNRRGLQQRNPTLDYPENMRRLRRWPNGKATLGQRLIFAG